MTKQFYIILIIFISAIQIHSQSDTILLNNIQALSGFEKAKKSFFYGEITATNNGISLIPSFTLGKPAALFDLSMGKGRWSFDPMLRFGLDGKPWSLIFWGRFKLFTNEKFKMSIGAHPSFVFRETEVITNSGLTVNYLNAQRYFAWEATPSYFFNKQFGLGVNYLGSRGLTKDLVQNTSFIALRAILPKLSISKKYYFTISPQLFYLKMDQKDGTYASGFLSFSKDKLPISISTIMSKKIDSEIAGNEFLWNIQLTYKINDKFIKVN